MPNPLETPKGNGLTPEKKRYKEVDEKLQRERIYKIVKDLEKKPGVMAEDILEFFDEDDERLKQLKDTLEQNPDVQLYKALCSLYETIPSTKFTK